MSASPVRAPQDDDAASARSSADRAAYVAVLVFPLLVLAGGAAGYLFAPAVHQAAPWTNPLLGLVMFGMGLTLRPADFALVARRPVPILVGVAAQYVLMPGIAVSSRGPCSCRLRSRPG